MIPSTEQVAENIKATVRGLALEIGKRIEANEGPAHGAAAAQVAEAVLIEWFLGDLIAVRDAKP